MRRHFGGQKPRQLYDHTAIIETAKTMTRQQINQKTGISEGYLAHILTAKGARPKPKVGNTRTEP
jgi:hypothetical protein